MVRSSMPSVGSFTQVSVPISNRLVRAGLCLVACAKVFGIGTPLAADTGLDSWTGAWEGELQNFPNRPGAPAVKIRREIGGWPEREGECADFRTIYSEAGVEKGRKDYKLCRRADPDQYIVDEGGGVELKARMLNDNLVSTFKYGSTLLIAITQVRGKEMTEEIFTAVDQPAGEAVVTLQTRSLQRLIFRRVNK